MANLLWAEVGWISRTGSARARIRSAASTPVSGTAASAPPSDEVTHVYCCDPDRSLCGLDLTGTGPARPGEQDCVVCADLDEADIDCPLCPTA